MLAAIPKVVFLVRIERDNYISSVINIRAAFGGHNYWLSFCFVLTVMSIWEMPAKVKKKKAAVH
jgi:hypothetical protein